jgi:hypothetical protein
MEGLNMAKKQITKIVVMLEGEDVASLSGLQICDALQAAADYAGANLAANTVEPIVVDSKYNKPFKVSYKTTAVRA